MGQDTIDRKLNEIFSYLLRKHGWAEADNAIYPLQWYIYTGRASTAFLHKLFSEKPYVIGRVLFAGGTVDEVIYRVKKHIGYEG